MSAGQSPENVDIKRARRDLYTGKVGRFDLVQVPPMNFLMVDGRGDPNTAPGYRTAVEALYATSYAVRAVARSELGLVHTVGPLEGLWYADDPRLFSARDKGAWSCTMLIWQPDWITPEVPSGHHHEIYLSDPRKVEPAKLKTILRQPISAG